jgi:hypothetical protein
MEVVLEEGALGGAQVVLEGAGVITVAVMGGVPTGGEGAAEATLVLHTTMGDTMGLHMTMIIRITITAHRMGTHLASVDTAGVATARAEAMEGAASGD